MRASTEMVMMSTLQSSSPSHEVCQGGSSELLLIGALMYWNTDTNKQTLGKIKYVLLQWPNS